GIEREHARLPANHQQRDDGYRQHQRNVEEKHRFAETGEWQCEAPDGDPAQGLPEWCALAAPEGVVAIERGKRMAERDPRIGHEEANCRWNRREHQRELRQQTDIEQLLPPSLTPIGELPPATLPPVLPEERWNEDDAGWACQARQERPESRPLPLPAARTQQRQRGEANEKPLGIGREQVERERERG